ncbi:MAG TPA: permease [Solirubrobacteraceae bacterium]|nr:permease [Solirubrobacteraceae bacterium]
MAILHLIWHGIRDALLMGWQVWWALALGFFVSALVQAWIPRERIESSLGGAGLGPLAKATGLGAASSSCSYAATAIAKSLFQKGASAAAALAFQLASTNLVWELGFVLWVLIGWQFTLAEYIGGLVMIALMALLLRRFVPARLEAQAREHARVAQTGHQHHMAGQELTLRQRLGSAAAWSDVAHNFRGDWQMLYREIGIGLLISGFVAQINQHAFHAIFLSGSPALVRTLWGAVIGPVIAMLTFVCSVGNVPLAAVLWSGGLSFAGVLAFIFADLVILPIVAIYRKYYGGAFAVRLVALLLVTMIAAALLVQLLFGAVGLIPSGARPSHSDIFTGVHADYKLVLNALGLLLFAALFTLTLRGGAIDPVCGMAVDRAQAQRAEYDGHTFYFCSAGCRESFDADPERYLKNPRTPMATVKSSSDGHPKHHTIGLTDATVHRHDD